jgi:hypothetical protein
MVNLLSPQAQKKLVREYYARLAILLCLLASVALLLGACLLAPSVFLARGQAESFGRYLSALEETVGLQERSEAGQSTAVLAERVRIANDMAARHPTGAILSVVLSGKPRGVRVESIRFSAGSETRISISGTAATRTILLGYADALRTHGALKDVALPVSSLVADTDVPFVLTATYVP